ncbi:stress enhanced protein 1, chloroplastic-like [Phalaenopsis equestris]|uniref:stress enhanced protein 1, chloroplastic-like n=1 Tax=Phalaenopsis equestris TaxID=78828 RepID=UPI0009E3EFAA|nr:stress enhanced protein 1, chloroplastic-like [Phalaenopsis equestris]
MAHALVASSTFSFLLNASAAKFQRTQASARLLPRSGVSQISSSFKSGSSLDFRSSPMRKFECRSVWVPIRCEQGAKESGGLDVWLGRLAMVGFATVITVEIVTGKGLLENFGFVTPLPSLALAVTALIGILAAVFIIQSATQD